MRSWGRNSPRSCRNPHSSGPVDKLNNGSKRRYRCCGYTHATESYSLTPINFVTLYTVNWTSPQKRHDDIVKLVGVGVRTYMSPLFSTVSLVTTAIPLYVCVVECAFKNVKLGLFEGDAKGYWNFKNEMKNISEILPWCWYLLFCVYVVDWLIDWLIYLFRHTHFYIWRIGNKKR